MTTMSLPRSNTDFTILIADEHQDCRALLRHIIAPEGFHLQEASNREEALQLVTLQPVHLFLCDLDLSHHSGLETVQRVRRVRWELPCILMSAQLDGQLMRNALELHIFSVLGKPIDKTDLLHTTRRALQRTYAAGLPAS